MAQDRRAQGHPIGESGRFNRGVPQARKRHGAGHKGVEEEGTEEEAEMSPFKVKRRIMLRTFIDPLEKNAAVDHFGKCILEMA
ncbi:MAG: hypothetical protein OEZ27_05520, partial [Nitrospinota bacterium]|nr:hypothetical protein [Nitrospinota bacterium]